MTDDSVYLGMWDKLWYEIVPIRLDLSHDWSYNFMTLRKYPYNFEKNQCYQSNYKNILSFDFRLGGVLYYYIVNLVSQLSDQYDTLSGLRPGEETFF